MKKGIGVLLVIAVIILIPLFMMAGSYNGLVSSRENVMEKKSQIDNQLQRRADLIPNLVNVVKGYAAHEKEVMEAVSDARAKLAGAADTSEKLKANQELNSALARLLMVVENYPDLKANENFRDLQVQLEGTENRIAVARRDYNNAAMSYNTRIKRFPTVIFAGMLGFKETPYFEAEESAKQVPEVNF